MSHSKKNTVMPFHGRRGFSLPEVMGALMVLAMVSSSVVLVIHRAVGKAADLTLRTQAFEVARENMEKLLCAGQAREMVEYGTSEAYPDISWQTVVETFNEPKGSQMWVRAVCSAEYIDTQGQTQRTELTHWLTKLSEKQSKLILDERKKKETESDDNIFQTIEEAAEHIGVDLETIEQWVKNGMRTTESGYYIGFELYLYENTNGEPTIADRLLFQEEYFGYETPDESTPDESAPGQSTDDESILEDALSKLEGL